MLTIRTSAHVPANRNLRGFRFSLASTGAPLARAGGLRLARERVRLSDAESRRFWLESLWRAHLRRVWSKRARRSYERR
jgi:hypothetical protein